jgi:hypothetical protein
VSRYSDEQLSMLLGEHDAGQLRPNGVDDWNFYWACDCQPRACALQVMLNEPSADAAWNADPTTATRFDNNYQRAGSPEELLALVAGVGR